jgi:hypothetical protein
LFQAKTEIEIFRKMLQAEAQAVIEGDIEGFMQINHKDIEVVDGDSNAKQNMHTWIQRNCTLQKWLKLEHYDLRIVKITDNKAWVVSV